MPWWKQGKSHTQQKIRCISYLVVQKERERKEGQLRLSGHDLVRATVTDSVYGPDSSTSASGSGYWLAGLPFTDRLIVIFGQKLSTMYVPLRLRDCRIAVVLSKLSRCLPCADPDRMTSATCDWESINGRHRRHSCRRPRKRPVRMSLDVLLSFLWHVLTIRVTTTRKRMAKGRVTNTWTSAVPDYFAANATAKSKHDTA